nr:PREDICTED: uncharacterized protein LOC103313025 isoform X2 [Tribolium castaneum]|eukprot:XP_015839728.1 PREDICTED: uncharacterized protein LOC103313025 isoform X2 [Tribolium castaneum]
MHLLKVLLVYVFLISPIKCVVGETSPQLIYELSEITKNLTDLSNIIDDNNYMTGDKKEEYVFTTLETIYVKIGGLNQSLYRDEMFQENLRGDKGSCNVFQSSRQLFDNFINGILLIHSESFVLEQTAFSIKNLYEQAVVGSKMQQSQDNFIVDINIITRLMKHYAEKIPTEMWRCHPDKHIKGTYT